MTRRPRCRRRESRWTSQRQVTGVEHWTHKGDGRASSSGRSSSARRKPSRQCSSCTARRWRRSRRSTFPCPDDPIRRSMDWFAQARLRVLGGRHGRLRPLGQAPRHLLRHRQWRRRPRGGDRLHRDGARRAPASWPTASRPGRCARRCSPSGTPSGWRDSRSTPSSGPAKARRRSSSGARSSRSFWRSKRRPIDRAFVHSIFERDHPDCAEKRRASMPSPTRSSRSTTRCPTAPTSTCARSCRSSIRQGSRCRR